jgi:NAD-reducing hydrogenase large subunit
VARQYLDGRTLTEGLLNHIEVAIRAFDPCLSCATHALGKMPLEAELVDADGSVIDRLCRSGFSPMTEGNPRGTTAADRAPKSG